MSCKHNWDLTGLSGSLFYFNECHRCTKCNNVRETRSYNKPGHYKSGTAFLTYTKFNKDASSNVYYRKTINIKTNLLYNK